MAERRPRAANIELLRIVSMFLIVTFHCSYKSGFSFAELDPNTFVIKMFWLFGELGVNLFMLISGYFLVMNKFKPKRLMLLLCEVLFYYLITFFIALQAGVCTLPKTGAEFFLLFFPTIMNKYWFVTAYILIFCLSPWINRALFALDKKSFLGLLALIFLFWSIIPTVFGIFIDTTEGYLYYNRFIWFFIMYVCGAYIRLYSFNFLRRMGVSLGLGIGSFALMSLFIAVIALNQEAFKGIGLTEWAYFWTPNSALMVLCSLGVFGVFLNIKMYPNRLIERIASTTLGIYLFHDGPVQSLIWPELLQLASYQHSPWLPLLILWASLTVFVIGALVDLLRQLLEKVTLGKLLDLPSVQKIYQGKSAKVVDKLEKL